MYRLDELARLVDGQVDGDPTVRISGVAPLAEATPRHISMAVEPRFLRQAEVSNAGALLITLDAPAMARPTLRVAQPRAALQRLLTLFAPAEPRRPGVHPQAILGTDVGLGDDVSIGPYAVINDGAVLGDGVTVYAGAVVGHGVHIGPETTIHANAVLERGTNVGARCIIRAGAVLGSDGYGFVSTKEGHRRMPHIGGVEISDDVEIGACTTIDKGTLGDTRVGMGTKIGNNAIIGHNVQIGRHCLIVGGAAIAGSVVIGDGAILAGVVAVIDHVHIGAGVTVGAKSLVTKDVPAGLFVSGNPARPHKDTLRQQVAASRLPQLMEQMRAMEKQIHQLQAQIHPNRAARPEDIP